MGEVISYTKDGIEALIAEAIASAGGVTQGDIDTAINALIDSAPGTLNTLNEIAAAMNDDATFAVTVNAQIAALDAAIAGIPTGLDMDPILGGVSTAPATHVATTTAQTGNNGAAAQTTNPINLPAGVQEGDLLIYSGYSNNPASHPTPSGWTVLFNVTNTGGASDRRLYAFYKFASASEPASYSFSRGGTATKDAFMLTAWRNAMSPVLSASASGHPPAATVLNGAVVVGVGGANVGASAGAFVYGVGWTGLADIYDTSGLSSSMFLAEYQAADANETLTPDFDGTATPFVSATFSIPPAGSDHVLASGDAGKVVEMTNGITATFTVSTDATATVPVGGFVIVRRNGTGIVNIIPSGGVTLTGITSLDKQYDEVWLHKQATNMWHSSLRPGSTIATQAELDAVVAALSVIGSNNQTDSYGLVLADAGKVIELNKATALNLTVPLNATQAFPIGTVIELWQQGAGQVTVVATGGVTIRSTEGKLKLYGQYASASLRKRGTDEWVLVGDLVT